MSVRKQFSILGWVLILSGFVSTLPAFARASGAQPAVKKTDDAEKKEAPARQPRQDQSKRVYTNDDFGWFHPSASSAGAFVPVQPFSDTSEASSASAVAQ